MLKTFIFQTWKCPVISSDEKFLLPIQTYTDTQWIIILISLLSTSPSVLLNHSLNYNTSSHLVWEGPSPWLCLLGKGPIFDLVGH